MKAAIKKAVRKLGFRIQRDRPGGRFNAFEDALEVMRGMGYAPKAVIDGGANMGQWTAAVAPIFPAAKFHMLEPQPACAAVLQAMAERSGGRFIFHGVAVTEPGIASVRMVGGGEGGGGTGAYIAGPGESGGEAPIEVRATTLDELLAEGIAQSDRALLKLDLERHELEALLGAEALLKKIEAALIEVQFYDIERNGRPLFGDIARHMEARGFELFDFACLAGRGRDQRLQQGDALFVRRGSPLLEDVSWA